MYLHESREWSYMTFLGMLVGGVLATVISFLEGASPSLAGNPTFWGLLLLIACLIVALNGSIRVTLTVRELSAYIGHLGIVRRTVALDDILAIQRTRIPWYKAKPSKGWFVKTERYAISPGEALLVHVSKGKPFLLQTRNAETLCRLIKQTQPRVEIR